MTHPGRTGDHAEKRAQADNCNYEAHYVISTGSESKEPSERARNHGGEFLFAVMTALNPNTNLHFPREASWLGNKKKNMETLTTPLFACFRAALFTPGPVLGSEPLHFLTEEQSGHTLPNNPEFLDFERTDGDAKQWPTNTKEVVDKDRQVNYMKPLGPDDGSDIHWRCQVAMKVAERLGKPSLMAIPAGRSYVLRSWPEGYRMYCHYKGKQSSPRQDLYLIDLTHPGSTYTKRFRSIPEFVPHALWLLTDPTLVRGNCQCKYCAKVPQRLISENLGYKSRSPISTPPPGSRVHRIGRNRERRSPRTMPGEHATVRRAPMPKPEKGPTQIMLRERYADLQAMYTDTTAELRRWYRIGELVWCALDPPIHGVEASITFWPGWVDDFTLKAETLPRPKSPSIHSADGDFEMEDGTNSTRAVTQLSQKSGSSNDPGRDGEVPYPITPHPGNSKPVAETPLPWVVRQKTLYKVKLLGINHDYVALETQVLPYQGYTPSHELLQALENVPIEGITSKPEEIAAFNPCPPGAEVMESELDTTGQHFADATAPYTLAIEIANGIAVCWAPTDEWEFKMVIPPPSPARPVDIADASASAPASESETYSLRSRAPQVPSAITQTRYQGLWLGAERIWTDDLVRLKAARGQIAPQGSPQILPPSGASKSTIAELKLDQKADEEVLKAHGARDRGVFMQLEALFVVDVPDASGVGVQAECRASGMLYELADEDWEEPPPGESSAEAVSAQDAWVAAGLSTPPRPRNPGGSPELHVGKPFMSAPSPLKQPPLSSQEIVASMPSIGSTSPARASVSTPSRDRSGLRKMAATTRADVDAPNTQLSHPKINGGVPLPMPPRGFRFRPILPEGFEVVVSLALISGRYYPRMLAHPMLRPIVRDMQGHANEAAARLDGHHLFALEGILPGFFNASEATRWKPGRSAMVRDAVAERTAGLTRVWDVRRQQAQEAVVQGPPTAAGNAEAVAEPGRGQDADADAGTLGSELPSIIAAAVGNSILTDAQAEPPTQSVPAA
ncbi:hypothetical protein BJV74DRAFT_795239 [Russula compacta]|nr:hypothetical protein BJV74DRAFT_795239 [Russula compacta]